MAISKLMNEYPLESGSYTAKEAARLLGVSDRKITRWMRGYKNSQNYIPPLWKPEIPDEEGHVEIGFRDLIELRFVQSFLEAGLSLITIRACLNSAKECIDEYYPFSTQQFRTDGKTIFLESIKNIEDCAELIDLRKKKYVFRDIIKNTFKDLEIENNVVARWWPFLGKKTIVIDPKRSFGQPITAEYGIPTSVLADAVESEGSIEQAARVFEITSSVLKDAFQFEQNLRKAA